METEIRALPSLAGRLPLPIPRPVHVGAPACGYPWSYAGYALLAGDVAAELDLPPAPRAALAAPLGGFLAALHALPVSELDGVPGDGLARFDAAARLPRARERLAELEAAGALAAPERVGAVLEQGLPPGFRPRADAAVHGDLDARHLLVSRAGRRPCPRA